MRAMPSAEEVIVRSPVVAYLLCIFFGFTGAHRIYCNRIGTGLLWFFTGGLFGIGWLVDLFLIPSLVREANAEAWSLQQGLGPIGPLPQPRPTVAAYGPPIAKPMPPTQQDRSGVAPGHRIVFCTRCGSSMQVPMGSVGAAYACPNCRTVLEIPA